ncbi:MAG: hypothetical protein RMK84_03355 [Oscillochloridaceae bacterium]|nr:hypothetical protein [Oscillochloridaceae bacterium]
MPTNPPHLSKPRATALPWWSFGTAVARSRGRLTVAPFLALLLTRKVAPVAQCWCDWCVEALRQACRQRQALDATTGCVPFLAWIVRLWQGNRLALTLDATTLGDRFAVLSVSVVYRGNGSPVAWAVLRAGRKGAWRREWLRLLRLLRPAIPRARTVVALADRGLYVLRCRVFRRMLASHAPSGAFGRPTFPSPARGRGGGG